jgi:TRAP-type C4-dicarboxylate transport system permease small subunit
MTATIVDWSDLLQTIGASIVAGVGITVAFSVIIWGTARFADLRREGRTAEAGLPLTVSGLALAVVAAGVVFGIVVMTTK